MHDRDGEQEKEDDLFERCLNDEMKSEYSKAKSGIEKKRLAKRKITIRRQTTIRDLEEGKSPAPSEIEKKFATPEQLKQDLEFLSPLDLALAHERSGNEAHSSNVERDKVFAERTVGWWAR